MAQVTFDDLMPRREQAATTPQPQAAQPRNVRFDDLMPGAEQQSDDYRGIIAPYRRDATTGEKSWAIPRMADPVISAVTAPGEALRGELQVMDDQGNVTPEATGRAVDFASVLPMGFTGMPRAPARTAGAPVRATRRVETPLQEASRRQGVTIPRGAATENRMLAETARRTSDIPIVGQPLRNAASQSVDDMGAAFRRTVDDLGSGNTARAGTRVVDDIGQYAGPQRTSTLSTRVRQQYDAVDGLVDDTILTPLRATASAADDIVRRRQASAQQGVGAAVARVQPALQREGLTYNGVKDLRTFFRQALDDRQMLSNLGMTQNEAQVIYRALSDDLRSAVSAAGGQRALRAFNRANQYAQVVARERTALDRILGTTGARSPENVVQRLRSMAGSTGQANIRALHRARRAVSAETWDDFSSAVLASMGRDRVGEFSGARFLTDWNKMSAQGRVALFRDASVRQSLDDLATIAARFDDLNKMGNYSQSGSLLTGAASVAGFAIDPLTTLSVLVPATVFAKIMARPTTARQVVLWARAYENAVLRPSTQAGRILARRAQPLAIVLARESGAPNAVAQFAASLKNIPTHAEGDDQPEGVNTENRAQ